jgi:hypothetical protein
MLMSQSELEKEGTMREQLTYVTKYDSFMTAFLYERVVLEGFSDDSASDGEGNWVELVGRRIVWGDDRGFVYSVKFANYGAAKVAFSAIADELNLAEFRTGRFLPDGSWEPAEFASWSDANPS